VLAAVHVQAEPIKGEAELGLVVTTGNSSTENYNGKLKLTTENEQWSHEVNLGALGSASEDQDTGEDQTTAEKYFANYKADRKLDDRTYLYGLTTWENDRFSGFEYQATTGVGYGYKLIVEEDKTLAFEVGPGYRYNAIDTTALLAEEDDSEITLRLAETYDWKFSDNAELNQYFSIEGGEDNTISRLGVGLKSQLNGSLSLRVGVDLKHTANPAKDATGKEFDDIDTESYATIGYSF
jgi:putative salt-induced outer membrane protein YdiY